MGKSIKKNLENKAANFKFYALMINEGTDAAHVAQHAIFIRILLLLIANIIPLDKWHL